MLNTNHPRERLVNTAARLVHKQGWTATGINQILSEANIPKGSFYYYFRSKEALGIAVLQAHSAQLKQQLERTLQNPQLAVGPALTEFFREVVVANRETEYRLGCPVGSFANEIANQSPSLLGEANRALLLYDDAFIALVQRGQKEGSFAPSIDPVETGKTLAMLLQGSFLAMKCAGSARALELALTMMRQLLFGAAATGQPVLEDLVKAQALAS